RDFLDAGFHIEGARVTRFNPTLRAALRGNLFDYGLGTVPCISQPNRDSLSKMKPVVDAELRRGEPIGLLIKPGTPVEMWVAMNRIVNALERTAVAPTEARFAITEDSG